MVKKKYLGQKNKVTGNTLSLRDNLENGEQVFVCGNAEKDKIFLLQNTLDLLKNLTLYVASAAKEIL